MRPGSGAIRFLPLGVGAGLTAALVTFFSPLSWVIWALDGWYAWIVVLAAWGLGAPIASTLCGARRPILQSACLGVAFGLGLLALLTLGLGIAGWLHRSTAWGVVGLGLVALAERARRDSTRTRTGATTGARSSPVRRGRQAVARGAPWTGVCCAALLAAPAAVLIFGASLPPGVLWSGEARGYDALEYHLQAPREYFESGRVQFLPHNVYASFPQQMEMLYLLLMHLAGGPLAGAIPAQALHAVVTALAAVAVSAWTKRGRPRVAALALFASTPWLTQVGCLAYVEGGMLLFSCVAAGLAGEAARGRSGPCVALTIGLLAGLAGGCKYTALVLVAAALPVATALAMPGRFSKRAAFVAIAGVGAALAFSPWLARNAAWSGNPVYPFAYEWFGGQAWSPEQAAQWAAGHALPTRDGWAADRAGTAARELFGRLPAGPGGWPLPSMYGVTVVGGVWAAVFAGRRRLDGMAGVWMGAILLAWCLLTHMPGRFAVPILVPISILAAGAVRARGVTGALGVGASLLVAGANASIAVSALRSDDLRWSKAAGISLDALVGQTELLAASHPLNRALPPGASVRLIGDAAVFYVRNPMQYTVVFSRDPWIVHAGALPAAARLSWLRERGVTHVAFNWPEIERLRGTYGFDPAITPAWMSELVAAGAALAEGEFPPGLQVLDVREPDRAAP